jgi:hypothetical protein
MRGQLRAFKLASPISSRPFSSIDPDQAFIHTSKPLRIFGK